MYFKSSLAALSHAMEDLVLAGPDTPLIVVNFQQERYYRKEIRRYERIAQQTKHLYVLAAPEPESGLAVDSMPYSIIPLNSDDELAQEWHLVIVGQHYSACLVCREQPKINFSDSQEARRFEGFWTFDPRISTHAARLLLGKIGQYRPELLPQVEGAWRQYGLTVDEATQGWLPVDQTVDTTIFGQRLVSYLQAGQYRLLKANRAIALQEERERLINAITSTIRNSLDPSLVLSTAVQELGQTFTQSRCILYCCNQIDKQVTIQYEFAAPSLPSMRGEVWSLTQNPLVQVALAQERAIAISNVAATPNLQQDPAVKQLIQRWQIHSWLLVPIRYQNNLLGMIELHNGDTQPYAWHEQDISLVEAIATQVGVALTQAQAYADLETLNYRLEALDRTQSNLIAIVGHELRTPLSTIQVCLESIATEPDMPAEFQEIMLDAALTDTARMRKLIRDFLTLSRLENEKISYCPESIQIQEAVSLALSSLKTRSSETDFPAIKVDIPTNLPPVRADGDGLVEVLTKLLENAQKFTHPDGEIVIHAHIRDYDLKQDNKHTLEQLHPSQIEVVIADTGRGIDPSQLEGIFRLFAQEEDFLRRSANGLGLGLAICRQIIHAMGGKIWAESTGKDRGSQFHFTLPIEPYIQYQNASAYANFKK